MSETASLAHMLTPVRSANQSSRDIKPEDNAIPGQSATDNGFEDFDKVLSRKIDRQKESTPDEPSQENTTSAETPSSNPAQDPDSNPGNNGEQGEPEQAGNPSENIDDVQLAATISVMGEAVSQKDPLNKPLTGQRQGETAQTATPLEKSVPANIAAEVKPLANGEEVLPQKQVMAENTGVSESHNPDNKQMPTPDSTEPMPKQLGNAPEPESQLPNRTQQDKSVQPDFQATLRDTQQQPQQGFQSQSNNSGTADSFQGETQHPQGVPLEAEISPDSLKGFEVQNVESMLHVAEPAENASLSASQAPARTGIQSNMPQIEAAKPVDQIVQHLSSISVSGAQQRIKLTLTPENLGTIRITFNQTEGEIVGILEVQKNQTRRQVEQALPQLISAMQNSGVQVRKIEVVQWNTNQDSTENGDMKGSDYSAAEQFHDESAPESSENIYAGEQGKKPSKLGENTGYESPIYGGDTIENGLNLFI